MTATFPLRGCSKIVERRSEPWGAGRSSNPHRESDRRSGFARRLRYAFPEISLAFVRAGVAGGILSGSGCSCFSVWSPTVMRVRVLRVRSICVRTLRILGAGVVRGRFLYRRWSVVPLLLSPSRILHRSQLWTRMASFPP